MGKINGRQRIEDAGRLVEGRGKTEDSEGAEDRQAKNSGKRGLWKAEDSCRRRRIVEHGG
jgi:hypothetical protein